MVIRTHLSVVAGKASQFALGNATEVLLPTHSHARARREKYESLAGETPSLRLPTVVNRYFDNTWVLVLSIPYQAAVNRSLDDSATR